MVTQINPAGNLPILSVIGASPTPVAARPAAAQTAPTQAQQTGSEDAAVAHVNQYLQEAQTNLRIQIDPSSGRTVFQIVQHGSGEVVVQVPSAEVLEMSRRIRALEAQAGASGALVDKQS
jgi:flagellar protein FlaG